MAGTRVEITIRDQALRDMLGRLDAAGRDQSRGWDMVGAALVSNVGERFEEGRGPGRQPWPQSLRARLQGGQTLVDSNRLASSVTHRASARGVEHGTNVIYAAIHQFGGTIEAKSAGRLAFRLADGTFLRPREVTIPARPFLGIDDDQEGIVVAELEAWLGEVAGPEARQ